MNDDPTVKDVLNSAANLPKKVGKRVLEAKIPVGAAKRTIQFVLSHWMSGVFSIAILVWASSHYLSEMQRARYVCYSPRADFTLPNKPSADVSISSAVAISPVAQFLASVTFAGGLPDPNFDFKKFISVNDPNPIYAPSLAGALSESDATKLLKYSKGQIIAACIADKSWLTLIVVVAHALLAYFLFLTIGRGRRWLSEEMLGG